MRKAFNVEMMIEDVAHASPGGKSWRAGHQCHHSRLSRCNTDNGNPGNGNTVHQLTEHLAYTATWMLCRCSADKIHSQSQRPKFKISTTSESQKFNIAGTKPNKEHACVGSAPGAEMLGLHGQSTGLTSAHQTMAGQRCCHSWSSCHRKAACSPLHLL